jgi:NAD(P)-dependent dehydrogenase (short-subunit alcohol dehydrogenase family)
MKESSGPGTAVQQWQNMALSRRSVLMAGLLGAIAAGTRTGWANTPRLDGSTALVTGSTDGLGRVVAGRLAELGAAVIVHGRNVERGAEVVSEIRAGGGDAVFYRADFASLDDVNALATTVLDSHDRLDILINNAGIWARAGDDTRYTSEDGHELTFAVNYLSGFLLTHRLLPLLRRSAPARVINVASLAQQPIDFDDVMLTRDFNPGRAYGQSKLAQILFTVDLARQLPADEVTVNSLHPATLMDTTMVRVAGAQPRSSVDEGAEAVMQLAVSPELAGRSGLYFNGLQEARANEQAYDDEALRRLRELSIELTGQG